MKWKKILKTWRWSHPEGKLSDKCYSLHHIITVWTSDIICIFDNLKCDIKLPTDCTWKVQVPRVYAPDIYLACFSHDMWCFAPSTSPTLIKIWQNCHLCDKISIYRKTLQIAAQILCTTRSSMSIFSKRNHILSLSFEYNQFCFQNIPCSIELQLTMSSGGSSTS